MVYGAVPGAGVVVMAPLVVLPFGSVWLDVVLYRVVVRVVVVVVGRKRSHQLVLAVVRPFVLHSAPTLR